MTLRYVRGFTGGTSPPNGPHQVVKEPGVILTDRYCFVQDVDDDQHNWGAFIPPLKGVGFRLRARKRLVVANGTSERPDTVMTMAGV